VTELVVEHDPVYWVLIDPLGDDMDSWATTMARERFPLEGREPAEGELELMAASLLSLAEQQSIRLSSNFLFAYTPLASLPLLLVDVLVLAASDGSETAMRDLTGADDTDLVEPADVRRVETSLGVAIRSRRYYRQEGSPALLAVLTYGWHLPEYGVDVRLSTAVEDLAALLAAEDDLHTLALACRLE
jgi:hypothetical protein